MTHLRNVFVCLMLAMLVGPFGAEPPDPIFGRDAAATALDDLVSNAEKLVTGVAREMPEGKYTFAPTAGEFRGVRTFARQLKHVAAVQYLVAFTILGEPVTADMAMEQGPDSVRTKDEVVAYVDGSFAALHRAAATVDAANAFAPIKDPTGSGSRTRVTLIAGALAHSSNHYGQMVEYLRMNGIVPPASR